MLACSGAISLRANTNRRSLHVAGAARVVRQHAHELRRHAMRRQHVVAARPLDVQEVILRRHLADGDELDAVLLAVRGVVEEVAEIALPFGLGQLLAHLVDVALGLGRAKNLKARGEDGAAVVEFAGRAQRIVRMHHFGKTDAVNPGGPRYDYPARPLIGINAMDTEDIREAIVQMLMAISF
jgi:hypothetical protein